MSSRSEPLRGGLYFSPGKQALYDVHGVAVAFQGDPRALGLLESRFQVFPRLAAAQPDLVFDFCGSDPQAARLAARPPGPTRVICQFDGGVVLYSESRDEMYVTYDCGINARCDPERGQAWISVLDPTPLNYWLAAHGVFLFPFTEMLRRRGRHWLHAAGLCVDGRGLVFVGATRSGKTTLTYALMRAGFGFLGDDLLFLSDGPQGLRIHAFPDDLDVTPDTGALFPALSHLATSAPAAGRFKHQVRPDDVRASAIVWECRPRVLIFPRVADADESVLTPIGGQEALLEVAPLIYLTQPLAGQAHFNALGSFVRESACYRLQTGRDFDRLADLLRTLMAS